MKTNNLTVSIPYKGCDKNCPYCVSKMTGFMKKSDADLMLDRVDKVIYLAKTAGATSVLFTSKGEAMLNFRDLQDLLKAFSMEFFCELQTNGIMLAKKPEMLETLISEGLTTLAVSIDNFNFDWMKSFLEIAKDNNLILRATVNLWEKTYEHDPADWIAKLKSFGFNQASFRTLTIPENCVDTEESKKAQEWIKEHGAKDRLWTLKMDAMIEKARKIRSLNFGPTVYGIDGIAVIHFPYCVQENNDGDDVRSLIFQEDAHLYDSWDDSASVLF